MPDRLQREIDDRLANGAKQVTIKQLDEILREIGYRLDRSGDCYHNARYMTGPRAGQTYPACGLRPVEADTGMGFAHYQARRDDNFKTLQKMRFEGHYFAVLRGHLAEL